MQAIRTQFFGPGSVRGARVVARCEGGSVTRPYPYEGVGEASHREAFEALVRKMQWFGKDGHSDWVVGGFGGDYYWIQMPYGGATEEQMLTGEVVRVHAAPGA